MKPNTNSSSSDSNQIPTRAPNTPLCVFYFSHPFGIRSPSVRKTPTQTSNRKEPPWLQPRWPRSGVKHPATCLLKHRHQGQNLPDLSTVIKTVQEVWVTPKSKTKTKTKTYSVDYGEPRSTEDTITVSSEAPSLAVMGSGAYMTVSGVKGPRAAPGLLRRRYSVPEIIMRKYTLAQQKSESEDSEAATVPTPRSRRSPERYAYQGQSSGSETNLSYASTHQTMRKSTLLRRMWNKELRKQDNRSGSWSPPLRRSQRRLNIEPQEHTCETCRRLSEEMSQSETITVTSSTSGSPKRPRLTTGELTSTSESTSTYTSEASSSMNESTITQTSTYTTVSTDRVTAQCDSTAEVTSSTTTDQSDYSQQQTPSTPEHPARRKNVYIYMNPGDNQQASEIATHSLEITEETTLPPESDKSYTTFQTPISDSTVSTSESIVDVKASIALTSKETSSEVVSSDKRSEDAINQYISNLLIDNLNNVVESVTEQTTNPYDYNVDSTSQDIKNANEISTVYLSAERLQEIVNKQIEELYSDANVALTVTSTNLESPTHVSETNINIKEESLNKKTLISQTMETLAVFSPDSEQTQNSLAMPLSTVGTGSTYQKPNSNQHLVVPRYSAMPRTESMEVNASSVNPSGEDSDCESLVDSLDDPTSPRNAALPQPNSAASVQSLVLPDNSDYFKREKAEAFFVPIKDSDKVKENVIVAEHLPDRVREKLIRRQRKRDLRKEHALRKKFKKVQKCVDEKHRRREANDRRNQEKKEIASISAAAPEQDYVNKGETSTIESTTEPKIFKKPQIKSFVSKPQKRRNKARDDILKLESFKIDAQGNMKMNTPTNAEVISKTREKVIRNVIMQSQNIEAPTKSNSKPANTPKIIDVRKKQQVLSDVRHMSLYRSQTSQDLHTDGPRRLYQKTEIHDGDKRIEILEIVECVDSSPETSPVRTVYRGHKFYSRKSKIPVPIYKMGKSYGYQKCTRIGTADDVPLNVALAKSQRFSITPNNSKVDKLIADLLIEALNNPEGVDFIKSPRDAAQQNDKKSESSVKRLPQPGSFPGRRASLPQTSRRSANIRYRQKFEVIPEERSSMSIESSNEEQSSASRRASLPNVAAIENGNDNHEASVSQNNSPRSEMTRNNTSETNCDSSETVTPLTTRETSEVGTPSKTVETSETCTPNNLRSETSTSMTPYIITRETSETGTYLATPETSEHGTVSTQQTPEINECHSYSKSSLFSSEHSENNQKIQPISQSDSVSEIETSTIKNYIETSKEPSVSKDTLSLSTDWSDISKTTPIYSRNPTSYQSSVNSSINQVTSKTDFASDQLSETEESIVKSTYETSETDNTHDACLPKTYIYQNDQNNQAVQSENYVSSGTCISSDKDSSIIDSNSQNNIITDNQYTNTILNDTSSYSKQNSSFKQNSENSSAVESRESLKTNSNNHESKVVYPTSSSFNGNLNSKQKETSQNNSKNSMHMKHSESDNQSSSDNLSTIREVSTASFRESCEASTSPASETSIIEESTSSEQETSHSNIVKSETSQNGVHVKYVNYENDSHSVNRLSTVAEVTTASSRQTCEVATSPIPEISIIQPSSSSERESSQISSPISRQNIFQNSSSKNSNTFEILKVDSFTETDTVAPNTSVSECSVQSDFTASTVETLPLRNIIEKINNIEKDIPNERIHPVKKKMIGRLKSVPEIIINDRELNGNKKDLRKKRNVSSSDNFIEESFKQQIVSENNNPITKITESRTVQTSPDINQCEQNNCNGNLHNHCKPHRGRAALDGTQAVSSNNGGWLGFCRPVRGSIAEDSIIILEEGKNVDKNKNLESSITSPSIQKTVRVVGIQSNDNKQNSNKKKKPVTKFGTENSAQAERTNAHETINKTAVLQPQTKPQRALISSNSKTEFDISSNHRAVGINGNYLTRSRTTEPRITPSTENVQITTQHEIKTNKNGKKQLQLQVVRPQSASAASSSSSCHDLRLPNPFTHKGGTVSSDSDLITSSDSGSDPHRTPVLPVGRWQGGNNRQRRKTLRQDATAGSYPPQSGWSVTVAGNYYPEMPPDVEMRLSFPKPPRHPPHSQSDSGLGEDPCTHCTHCNKHLLGHCNVKAGLARNNSFLPPASQLTPQSRRGTGVTVTLKNQGGTTPRVAQRNFNVLPSVNTAPSKTNTKKSIKRVECITAMSSTTGEGIQTAHTRSLSIHGNHPPEMGQLLEHKICHHLSEDRNGNSNNSPRPGLSVMGSAIAPEKKPRVPTMSERDLTRAPTTCFTRNRPFQ